MEFHKGGNEVFSLMLPLLTQSNNWCIMNGPVFNLKKLLTSFKLTVKHMLVFKY